jgi:hypothetical protein
MAELEMLVFELINSFVPVEFAGMLVAAYLVIKIQIKRRGSKEVSALKKENYRLRNILAELMIDNAHPKDAK